MIAIIDYGMGNLGSMANMLKKIGAKATITADPVVIAAADKLILPGVGAFDSGMTNLAGRGLVNVLNDRVLKHKVPILGVCLGVQLFTRQSEEGDAKGLGWLDAVTVRFKPDGPSPLKVPHMGWNTVEMVRDHPLFQDLPADSRFYFVHSYHLVCEDAASTLAMSNYGERFAVAAARDNVVGVQFHPEKSHRFGMKLLQNFVEHF
jgi:glutamine amidotransferase